MGGGIQVVRGLGAGGGPNAFSRFENGKTKPPLALVKLLMVLDRHPKAAEGCPERPVAAQGACSRLSSSHKMLLLSGPCLN